MARDDAFTIETGARVTPFDSWTSFFYLKATKCISIFQSPYFHTSGIYWPLLGFNPRHSGGQGWEWLLGKGGPTKRLKTNNAHAGSRTQVTSMGGLYDQSEGGTRTAYVVAWARCPPASLFGPWLFFRRRRRRRRRRPCCCACGWLCVCVVGCGAYVCVLWARACVSMWWRQHHDPPSPVLWPLDA
jgi:hypothetical protein